MSQADERTPLHQITSFRSEVITSLQDAFTQTIRVSQPLLTTLLALTLIQVADRQILISAFALCFSATDTQMPLKWWVAGTMGQDTVFFAYLCVKIPKLKRALDSNSVLQDSFSVFLIERVFTV